MMGCELAVNARKIGATFKRDARLMLSYRLAFVLEWLAIGATVVSLWFISRLVPASTAFGGAHGSYFDYALINVAFVTLQAAALRSFDTAIRNDQIFGTQEAVFSTPTSVTLVVLASGAWAFTLAFIQVGLYLAISIPFGLHLAHVNVPSLVAFTLLTITATVPLGIFSAAAVMRFKQGSPAQFIFGRATALLAGVLFPVSLLPFWLQACSWMLPITHALNGIRGAFRGAPLSELAPEAMWLAVATAALIPLSVYVFQLAVARAKVDGTLGQY
jgi:ABC-2 type transport system permease protein